VSQKRQNKKTTPRVAALPRPRVTTSRPRVAKPPGEKFEQAFEKIYRFVLRIPRGCVMTYGQIARLLEDRYSPRLVGWAMHATPKDERNIPWHRVINSQGGISTGRVILQEPQLQRLLLEAEGVIFDARGHCDLRVYQWSPAQKQAKAEKQTLLTARKPGAKVKGKAQPKASATRKPKPAVKTRKTKVR
jgi:methylated-DNA-protein-cysteine methyltransferase-like protein